MPTAVLHWWNLSLNISGKGGQPTIYFASLRKFASACSDCQNHDWDLQATRGQIGTVTPSKLILMILQHFNSFRPDCPSWPVKCWYIGCCLFGILNVIWLLFIRNFKFVLSVWIVASYGNLTYGRSKQVVAEYNTNKWSGFIVHS